MFGIGFKPVHADALLADGRDLDFIEVHAENLMGAGGPAGIAVRDRLVPATPARPRSWSGFRRSRRPA